MGLLKSLWREVVGRTTGGDQPRATSPASAEQRSGDDFTELSLAYSRANLDQRHALVRDLEQRVVAEPDSMTARRLLADWQLDTGSLENAERNYRLALQQQPLDARGHEGLGLCLLQRGRIEEAYLRLESASKLAPENPEVWVHWGLADLELGNLERAAGKFQKAIDRSPENPHAWHNLALVSLKQGKTRQSIEQFERAIGLKPDHGLAYSNLALALMQDDRLEQAEAAARQAADLKGNSARIWVVLADVLMARGSLDPAEQSIHRALTLDARHVGAHLALAKLHVSMARHADARLAYESALAIEPENAEAQAGLGQLLLLLGEWGSAWKLYEARKRTATTPVRSFPYLEWQGQHETRERLLVHAEQGLGDIILFSSCLPDLAQRCSDIVLEVPSRMQALFTRSFPWAEVIGHEPGDNAMGWLSQGPPIQRQIAIGSLPRWLRQHSDDFRSQGPFLVADADRTEAWRQRLSVTTERPVIGIAWRGGLAFTGRSQRSLPLAKMVEALAGSGVRLVSLQHGEVEDDLAECQDATGIQVERGISGYADLDELAALTSACHGVVTVCSTQAHLTGGLGRPGLVLVPFGANWRYGASGTRMIWYPTLELARQSRVDDWTTPIARLKDWVRDLGSDIGQRSST